MFKHSRAENYPCASCEQIKHNCVVVHVPGESMNMLFIICEECLEVLHDATKEEISYSIAVVGHSEDLSAGDFHRW